MPAPALDWHLLGSPPQLFGFSRHKSDGFLWAREACLRHAGDVTLASLDTHLDAVVGVVRRHYGRRQFYVDATRLYKNGKTV